MTADLVRGTITTTSEWLGLLVDRVDKAALVRVQEQGYTAWRELPVEPVKFPVANLSTVAIVSWRWDTDEVDHPSRNVLSAILQAQRMGIRYLFIDVISIDQRLTGDSLIRQVTEFSKLYRSIPVIAAYDKIGAEFKGTLRRPWISNEIQAFRNNPTKIVYVGHSFQGAARLHSGGFETRLPVDLRKIWFPVFVELIWRSSFATTIMMLIAGTVSMRDITDLKYIMPKYAPVLKRAHERMSPNDYLFTAALLSQCESSREVVNDKSDPRNEEFLEENKFTSYSFETVPAERMPKKEDWYRVSLNGAPVARFIMHYNSYTEDSYYNKIAIDESTEQVICAALGMTGSEYERYLAEKETLRIDSQANASLPKIEVVHIDLE